MLIPPIQSGYSSPARRASFQGAPIGLSDTRFSGRTDRRRPRPTEGEASRQPEKGVWNRVKAFFTRAWQSFVSFLKWLNPFKRNGSPPPSSGSGASGNAQERGRQSQAPGAASGWESNRKSPDVQIAYIVIDDNDLKPADAAPDATSRHPATSGKPGTGDPEDVQEVPAHRMEILPPANRRGGHVSRGQLGSSAAGRRGHDRHDDEGRDDDVGLFSALGGIGLSEILHRGEKPTGEAGSGKTEAAGAVQEADPERTQGEDDVDRRDAEDADSASGDADTGIDASTADGGATGLGLGEAGGGDSGGLVDFLTSGDGDINPDNDSSGSIFGVTIRVAGNIIGSLFSGDDD